MPGATTHATIGGLAFAFAATHLPPLTATEPETLLLGGAVAVLASLVPDIDQPGSTISRICWPITYPLSKVVFWSFGHRGITHALWVALLLSLAAFVYFPSALAYGFVIGWFCHIIPDACEPMGVPSWPGGPRLRLGWR